MDDDPAALSAGGAGSRRLGHRRSDLEQLPITCPPGVDPDVWVQALMADRRRGWLRFTTGAVVRAHPSATLSALSAIGGGAGAIALRVLGGG